VVRDNRGGHNRKSVNEDFFKEWTKKMAYVLGFIYADGAVEDCRRSSRTCYLCIAITNLPLLKQIRLALSSNHNIQVKKAGIVIIRGKKYYRKDCYCLRIGNILIYQDLINLGLCPRKSLIMELPKIPDRFFSYFLRGYFDGDGCLSVDKKYRRLKIIFTSGSKKFLDQIRSIVNLNCHTIYNSGAFRLIYHGKKAETLANFMYHDLEAAPFLEYKYEKYLDYLKIRREKIIYERDLAQLS